MDSPFFTNRRWFEQPDPNHRPFHPSARGVPVYHVDPSPESHRPVQRAQRPTERPSAPKIVRIPVQFLGSGQLDRTGSAVKIQKVFRGLLVRKSLRKIKDIKLQVDEIEERLKRSEVVDLVRRDPKERLRLNESLMALLLKLDSICGVDFGVRGCRKAVIRKAIALQEMIDAIVTSDLGGGRNGEIVDLESESNVTSDVENSAPPANLKGSCCEDDGHLKDSIVDREDFEVVSCGRVMEVEGGDGDDEAGIVDVGVDCEVKVSEANENLETVKGNDSMTNRELLEKMMKENEKMMSMMSQLFEKTDMQTRMLNGLTHRVELLEKAVVCDRLRKKKKKTKPTEN